MSSMSSKMIQGNLRIPLIRNEFEGYKNFNVLKNITAIMSLYSPHKLGFFADAWATIELLEKFNFIFPFTEGGRVKGWVKKKWSRGQALFKHPKYIKLICVHNEENYKKTEAEIVNSELKLRP